MYYTYDVDGPDVDIGDGVQDLLDAHGLSVVHVALGWIVAKKTVDQHFFLCLCPPFVASVFTSEKQCRLDDGGRHHSGAYQPDNNANKAFDEESGWLLAIESQPSQLHLQPLPSSPSSHSSHLQNPTSKKRAVYLRDWDSSVEDRQSNRQFVALIKV